MRYERMYAIFLGFVAMAVVCMAISLYAETQACKAKGGARLRTVLGNYKCYDAKTLKVLE